MARLYGDSTYATGTYGELIPWVTVEVAFTNNPGDASPTWVDISPYVLFTNAFQTRRGRNRELDRAEAGTARILLNNHDRRFEPLYTGSPYYPNVLPMKPVRIRVTHPDVAEPYSVFRGFVESWPQTYDGWGNQVTVDLSCVDAFEVLAQANFYSTGTRPAELTSERINYVLDQIGWPAGLRNIAVGNVTASAYDFDNYNALQHIQEMAETEAGVVFVDGQGRITFHNRQRRSLDVTVYATFSDAGTGGVLPYTSIGQPTVGKEWIYNYIVGRRANDGSAVDILAEDTSSRDAYLRRSMTKSPWVTSDADVTDLVNYLLSRYKDPQIRIQDIVLEPGMDTGLWAQAFAREISDRVRWERTPSGGISIAQEVYIESIAHSYSNGRFETRFGVSPADVASYWVLGTAGQSELGTTTRLGF